MGSPQITQECSGKRTSHTATSKLHLEELLCSPALFWTSIISDSERMFILKGAKAISRCAGKRALQVTKDRKRPNAKPHVMSPGSFSSTE